MVVIADWDRMRPGFVYCTFEVKLGDKTETKPGHAGWYAAILKHFESAQVPDSNRVGMLKSDVQYLLANGDDFSGKQRNCSVFATSLSQPPSEVGRVAKQPGQVEKEQWERGEEGERAEQVYRQLGVKDTIMNRRTLLPSAESVADQHSVGKDEYKEKCDVCNVAVNFCECGARCTGCYNEQPQCYCGARPWKCACKRPLFMCICSAETKARTLSNADNVVKLYQKVFEDVSQVASQSKEPIVDMDIRIRLARKYVTWAQTLADEIRAVYTRK